MFWLVYWNSFSETCQSLCIHLNCLTSLSNWVRQVVGFFLCSLPLTSYVLEHPKAFLKKILQSLPRHNYNLLYKLILFLQEISKESELNKMTAANLAIVFMPNLCECFECHDCITVWPFIVWASDPTRVLVDLGERTLYGGMEMMIADPQFFFSNFPA